MFKCIIIFSRLYNAYFSIFVITEALKDRLFQVICLFECNHIKVEALCCDLGPLNKAVLNRFGISANVCNNATNLLNIPDYNIVNSFQNPFRNDSQIKIFLDFTHVFKRLRSQLERTDLIIHQALRARFINEYYLSPAENCCSFHWIRLLHHREEQEREENGAAMTLTNLTFADIWPSGYQRMRVKHTSKVFSDNVASALLAYKQKYEEFGGCHPTAILILEAAQWFRVVNNFHSDRALSASNLSSFESMKRIIINFANLIVRGKFVKTGFPNDFPDGYHLPNSAIKPIQSSIAISTTSLLMIADDLMKENAPTFYTANLCQDSLESLFGQLRADGCGNPTPLRVLQLLKSRILTFRNMANSNFQFFEATDSQSILNNSISVLR